MYNVRKYSMSKLQLLIDEQVGNIYLDHDQTSFITLHRLPQTLVQYGMDHFEELYQLHPQKRHRVVTWEKELEVKRWQQSYMHTPEIDTSRIKQHSYMYSGFDTAKNKKELDPLFVPFYQYMYEMNPNYNQVTVNWYEKYDYIAMHKDCDYNMIDNYKIAIMSIYDNPKNVRILRLKARNKNCRLIYDDIRIVMRPDLVVVFGGDIQKHYIHGVPNNQQTQGPRISISLRQMKV